MATNNAWNSQNPAQVSLGGTGQNTLTSNGVVYGNGTSAAGITTAGTNGQLLVAATSAAPAFATLTSTAGSIAYTTGANSLNIDITNFANATAFSPTVTFGGGSTGITYSSNSGHYIRLGQLVVYWITITMTSKGSSSGAAVVNGLPFSISNGNLIPVYALNLTYTGVAVANGSGTTLPLIQAASGASAYTALADTNFANNTQLNIAGFYGA